MQVARLVVALTVLLPLFGSCSDGADTTRVIIDSEAIIGTSDPGVPAARCNHDLGGHHLHLCRPRSATESSLLIGGRATPCFPTWWE